MNHTLFRKMPCPACGGFNCVIVDIASSFITEDYVDIPAKCKTCDEELHVTYDFTVCAVD